MAQQLNAFEVLGVNSKATDQEVDKAFRTKALGCHPDKGGSAESMHELTLAKDRLRTISGRAQELQRTCPAAPGACVCVHGLTQDSSQNGHLGRAGAWDGLRLQVHLPSGIKAIRARNLVLVPGISLAGATSGTWGASASGTWSTSHATTSGAWASSGAAGYSTSTAWASSGAASSPTPNPPTSGAWASSGAAGATSGAWASSGAAGATSDAWAYESSASPHASIHAAAAAGVPIEPVNGLTPCCGRGGQECPQWAWVKKEKVRCRGCAADLSPPPVAPSPPPSTPSPQLWTAEDNIAEARALSRLLAAHGERGFAALASPSTHQRCYDDVSIYEETLWRLALIGDHNIVPVRTRKLASHCGGVPPRPPQLMAFKDTPNVADPGNAIYSRIVRKLFQNTSLSVTPPRQASQIDHIKQFNDEHLADLVEAALAAADMAAAFESGKQRSWSTLIGGSHGDGDNVSAWLVHVVHFELGL
jgi:hypothetical protein